MTRAAYRAAIEWATASGVELGLECDVQFSADDQLVCLHDLNLQRTAGRPDRPVDLTVAQLKRLDFGSWVRMSPDPEERELVTLDELLSMTAEARAAGARVSLAIETKHPNPRALDVEDRLAEMLVERGWHRPGSPVRVITGSVASLDRLALLLPELPKSLLIWRDLQRWWDQEVPDGVSAVGVKLALLRLQPDFARHIREQGREVHVFTVNHPDDVRYCRELGVTAFTTDCPPEVHAVLDEPVPSFAVAS
jgi:glycerophosphoryl diester phosphodiesterase